MKLVVLAIVLGCAGCGDNRLGCVPGEQAACGCPGGALGTQTCSAASTFGTCTCPVVDDAPIACNAQTDCPTGDDCGLAHPTDAVPTCYHRTYSQGFGTSCAFVADGCTTAMSPCAPGFQCLADAKCDPAAVCTRSCTADTDCPPTMFCADTATDKLCAPRQLLDPCAVDDQCGPAARCATDAHGYRYCAKTCASDADCPQPGTDVTGTMVPATRFSTCVDDPGGRGMVCAPTDGGAHPDGMLCSICRPHEYGDCANGTRCFTNEFTSERFCTQPCTVTIHADDSTSGDTCPTGFVCYTGLPPGYCISDCVDQGGTCTRSYAFLTCYP